MEKSIFIDCVSKQLQKMSSEQKDEWILTKAKLLSESEQKDFLMSLGGEKRITYMPTETEIETFCEDVQNGVIYVEYESHYYEFNSEGRYIDDWIIHHNDPQNAFLFLDRAFRGCHDLLKLEDYDLAWKILNKICRLEFQVKESENSSEYADFDDTPFTIVAAIKEQQLSMGIREIAYDWSCSLIFGSENDASRKFAEKLLDVLESELCKDIQPSVFCECLSKKLLNFMEEILEKEIQENNAALEKITDRNSNWHKRYTLEKRNARNQHLLLDIRKKCRKQNSVLESEKKVSVLKASWGQICELLKSLSYYGMYIDDQLEIDEVWAICDALIRRNRFEEEAWEIRKNILKDLVANEYYECYNCYDPLKGLAEKLCVTDAEMLEFADILNQHEYHAKEAAEIYRQYGKMDLYVQYLENHLYQSSETYVKLIKYYCDVGKEAEAYQVAEQGLQNCKDDLTELFIFLLQQTKKRGDEKQYKKFYASAKRRKYVDIDRVNEKINT